MGFLFFYFKLTLVVYSFYFSLLILFATKKFSIFFLAQDFFTLLLVLKSLRARSGIYCHCRYSMLMRGNFMRLEILIVVRMQIFTLLCLILLQSFEFPFPFLSAHYLFSLFFLHEFCFSLFITIFIISPKFYGFAFMNGLLLEFLLFFFLS